MFLANKYSADVLILELSVYAGIPVSSAPSSDDSTEDDREPSAEADRTSWFRNSWTSGELHRSVICVYGRSALLW